MIHKIKQIEWIGKHQMSKINGHQKPQIDDMVHKESKSKEDIILEKEIQDALSEADIIKLRKELNKIVKPVEKNKGYFELLDDFTTIDELSLSVPPDELLDIYDSLPKVHIYQHQISKNENTHQFYKQQMMQELLEEFDEDFFDCELDGLEDALLEKDILELRKKLNMISKAESLQFSSKEIEQYVTGEMKSVEKEHFIQELSVNNALKREAELYDEVNKAVEELDINNLRQKLSKIMNAETSWNVSGKSIEEYIEGEIKGKQLTEFEAEYNQNTDLKAEVNLRREVDEAIGERDIIILKEKLSNIHKESQTKDVKSIVPEHKLNNFYWVKVSVAVAIIIFVFSGLVNYGFYGTDRAYETYYNAPEWSHHRSVEGEQDYFSEASEYFAKGDYHNAVRLYDEALKESKEQFVYHFYKGASLQSLNQYQDAINEYERVIRHGDNIFIEDAEWYRSLCFLKMKNFAKAREHLVFIVNKNGYYSKNAKAILRKLKYSFRKG